MVGLVQRDKAFGVFCRVEDVARILDTDRLIQRGMKNEKGLFQRRRSIQDAMRAGVFDELFSDQELAPGKIYLGGTAILDVLEARPEVLQDMADIGRRPDRRHRADLWNVSGDGENCGAAEGMAD